MSNTFLYIVCLVIWGTTWIAINYQLGDVSPAVSIIYRFAFAALILFLYCKIKSLPLKFNLKQHTQLFIFGATLFGCNYYFIYHAQQYINSALTCIACSLLLLFNILNARIFFKTPINKQVYIGGVLGLVGIGTLFWPQVTNLAIGNETILGFTLCVIGTLFASIGNMISIRNHQQAIPMLPANAWAMLYGATSMMLIALIQGETFKFAYNLSYISSLLYLSVFGSVIAFGCYLTLLNRIGAHKASYITIMFPAVAVIISTIFENFSWSSYTVFGLAFIFIGNFVVLAKPKQRIDSTAEVKLSLAKDY